MCFSLPLLFAFLVDVLKVAVFIIRDRYVKKIIQLVLKSLSLCNKVLSYSDASTPLELSVKILFPP